MPHEPAFETDPEAFRRAGHALVDWMAQAMLRDQEDPVLARSSAAEVLAGLDEPLPREGRELQPVLERLGADWLPHLRRNGHPRLFAYVQASADPLAALFDAVASLVNQNVTAWRSSPGATAMEQVVVRWLDELVGFEGGGSGLFVGGGSAANGVGLACALRRTVARAGEEYAAALPHLAVYRTSQAHLSCDKALRGMGLEGEGLRRVETDAARRMDPGDLARRIAADRAAGRLPACVFASAGTANDGTIDPLDAIAEVCAREDVWMHVDGAYGAPAAATPDYAFLRTGFARADSLSIDPHKWLFAPLDAGCALVRDAADLRAAFAATSEYVSVDEPPGPEAYAFFEHGPELSRRARALKVWAILQLHGADALAGEVARNCALREHLDGLVAAHPALEPLGSGLSIACFRYHPAGLDDPARLDALNRAILDAVCASGRFLFSPTVLEGRFALRVCIVNIRTRVEDIEALVEALVAAGERLSPSAP